MLLEKTRAKLEMLKCAHLRAFSDFHDKSGYAGFYPSGGISIPCIWTTWNTYDIFDQCVAALTGYVINGSHLQTTKVFDEIGRRNDICFIIHYLE